MRLVLVRHGRPDEDEVERPNDPPLHEDGWRQARTVAALLAEEGISRIIASPLRRARQTAEPLAERLAMPIDIVDGWVEADRHVARYRSMETLRAQGDEEWKRFLGDPIRYLGGDPVAFRGEVLAALGAVIAESDKSARVAVFTHGMPINIVLSHALGLEGLVNFPPAYASVTRLRVSSDGAFGVVSVNECAHHAFSR
jgi:broad specificity phosphatase PhoE